MPSRDDESEAIEQAELAATFYKTLLGKGVSFSAAKELTVAFILSKAKKAPEWDQQ